MGLLEKIKAGVLSKIELRNAICEEILNTRKDDFDCCFSEGVTLYLRFKDRDKIKTWGCLDALGKLAPKVSDGILKHTYDSYSNKNCPMMMLVVVKELGSRGLIEKTENGDYIKNW